MNFRGYLDEQLFYSGKLLTHGLKYSKYTENVLNNFHLLASAINLLQANEEY